jgi:hypothetical protein
MATLAENLDTAINNIGVLLVQMTASPKPSYGLDGESYSWSDYFAMLTAQLKALQEQRQLAGGPIEVRSRGIT